METWFSHLFLLSNLFRPRPNEKANHYYVSSSELVIVITAELREITSCSAAISTLAVEIGLGPQNEDSISVAWGEADRRWPENKNKTQYCSEFYEGELRSGRERAKRELRVSQEDLSEKYEDKLVKNGGQ